MKINTKKLTVSDEFIKHCLEIGVDIENAMLSPSKNNTDVQKILAALQQLKTTHNK